jgi:uncharacterized protein
MKTRPDEALAYHELARQGAQLVRTIPAADLARLAEVAPGQGDARVALRFRRDDDGRPWVSGSVAVAVQATCQRCLVAFEHDLEAPFELCIVGDPEQASTLAASADVLVASGDVVTIADVVEDELLLGIPERLCRADPCEHAPATRYPQDGDADQARRNPFEILSALKS